MYSQWDLSKARDLAKDVDPYKDLKGVSSSQCLVLMLWPIAQGTPVLRQESMKLYQAAMVEYGKAPCELLLIFHERTSSFLGRPCISCPMTTH